MKKFVLVLLLFQLGLITTMITGKTAALEPITDKTYVVWAAPANLTQRAGSILTLDMVTPEAFDALVYAEYQAQTWMPGSTLGKRNHPKQESWPRETAGPNQFVQMAIVYHGQTITVYRDGKLYATYESTGAMQTFDDTAVVMIGPRHYGNRNACFLGKIKDARVYGEALDQKTIAAMKPGQPLKGKTPWVWWDFTQGEVKERSGNWPEVKLYGDIAVQDGALCIGPKWGMLLAKTKNNITDWTTQVPKYTFSRTLSEQQKELTSNPLLKQFAESRQKLASDIYRPIYHFTCPEGGLNDPNGLSFWQGNWHMFYQWIEPMKNQILWGHAISTDMVHWKDLPPAIYPNPEQSCWSGSVFVEKDRAIATYYGNQLGTMVAVSDDPLLLNWEKVTGTVVIPHSIFPVEYSIFDSCIWKEGDHYYLLSAGAKEKGKLGVVRPIWYLFESTDLAHWNYLHPFVEDDYASRIFDDGACPYFWPIGDQSNPDTRRHILLHFSHSSGGKYLVGHYNTTEKKFYVKRGDFFNQGPAWPSGLHAPSAFPDGKGGIVTIFNTNPGRPTDGCNQIMSLPIQLNLLPKDQLAIKPFEALNSLRGPVVEKKKIALPANKEIVLDNLVGNSSEFRFVINRQKADIIELKVLRSNDDAEYSRIAFYANRGYMAHGFDKQRFSVIELDTSHSSLINSGIRPTEQAQVLVDVDKPIEIRVFVDKSIVEVFVNNRQLVLARVYPTKEDSQSVSIRALGENAVLESVEAWSMKAIFPTKK